MKTAFSMIAFLTVALLILTSASLATDRLVPSEYFTIQSAIDAAEPGDTVIVDPCTYTENISFDGKNITLTSTNPDDPCIVAGTVIDGGGSGPVVTFAGTEDATCKITGFTITGGNNSEDRGGGISGNYTQTTIENCVITNNAALHGGGMSDCDGTIRQCFIGDNTAASHGGGLVRCNAAITNCQIYNNTAYYGGGMNNCDGVITNCTVAFNTAVTDGGGLRRCDGVITNCIVWGNSPDQLFECAEPVYSCFAGGTGTNIDVDPAFVDAAGGDWHLMAGSLCIDTGTNTPGGGLASKDLDGNARLWDGDGVGGPVVDMGSYEYGSQISCIDVLPAGFEFSALQNGPNPDPQILNITNICDGTLNWEISENCDWIEVLPESGSSSGEADEVTLSANIAGLADGHYTCALTISDPCVNNPKIVMVSLHVLLDALYVPLQYSTIQAAINAAGPGDIVIVAEGAYTENIICGKDITLRSVEPDSTAAVASTVIYGARAGAPVVIFEGMETSECVLAGFTITGGNNGAGRGGGISGNYTQATIENCVITNNTAWQGGGMSDCDGIIRKCIISDNTADFAGGLVRCNGAILNCQIYNNTADTGAGGLNNCDGDIIKCTIASNTTTAGEGGGLRRCDGLIKECIIANNHAGTDGGGLWECNGLIENCKIKANTAEHYGGGLAFCAGTIIDCAITNNSTLSYGPGNNGDGGGLFGCGPVNGCIISGNSASRGGGLSNCINISNCTIENNIADHAGGGVSLENGYYAPQFPFPFNNEESSDITITNCTIRDNLVAFEKQEGFGGGGGIYIRSSIKWGLGIVTINNCEIVRNMAIGSSNANCGDYGSWSFAGGGIYCSYGSFKILNSTIADNITDGIGGGVYCGEYNTNVTVKNSIVWNNISCDGSELRIDNGYQSSGYYSSVLQILYSDIKAGRSGISVSENSTLVLGPGNIDRDPLFVNSFDDNYRLSVGSPCIDAGTDAGVYDDIDGIVRPFDFPGVDNNGAQPEFDMGAREAVATEVGVHISPKRMNRNRGKKDIRAVVRLPDYEAEQIDGEFILFPGAIVAKSQEVKEDAAVLKIIAYFDRTKFLQAVPEDSVVELTVTGKLKSGKSFYGNDNIEIFQRWH